MSQPDNKPSIAGAVALIVVGLLIFVPSGLCTGLFMFGPLILSILHPGASSGAEFGPMALIIGGPFVAGGGALVWLGIRRLRASRRKPDHLDF